MLFFLVSGLLSKEAMPRRKTHITQGNSGEQLVRHYATNQRRYPLRIHKLLSDIYFNIQHPHSFSSVYRLFKAAKEKDPRIKLFQVRDWLTGNKTYTTYRRVVTKFPRRKVVVRGPKFQYQADLMDYQPLARENNGMHYLLTVIDCFSRFATIIPLKDKSGIATRDGLDKAFRFMGLPKKIQTDHGKEFHNHVCKYYFDRKKIIHFSTYQEVKASICERFNRTVRDKIKKYMSAKRTLRFVDILPDLLKNYNSHPHSTLGVYSPEEVNNNNKAAVYEHMYGKYLRKKRRPFKFKVGDLVRLASYKQTFRHSNAVTFTEEVFSVAEVLDTKPPMYRILDPKDNKIILGPFYEPQMQKWKPLT